MVGKITHYNHAKGYGFISAERSEDGSTLQQQFFFHHSNFTKGETPLLGGLVVFQLGQGLAGKKVQALGIRFATAHDIEERIAPRVIRVLSGAEGQ